MKRWQIIFLLLVMVGVTLPGNSIVSAAPDTEGEWTPVIGWPEWAIHAHLLPTGQVLFWRGNNPYRWDPQTEIVTAASSFGIDYDLFCAGHSFLSDGRLLVTGGKITKDFGIDRASIYNPFTDAWENIPPTNAGRYYPSSTTLANGDVLVASGQDESGTLNPNHQVYDVETNTWRDLTNAQLTIPMYPRTFLAPNGLVFFATMPSRYLDTVGAGSWSVVDMPLINHVPRIAGSAVMYDEGKVLWAGGDDPPTAAAEVIDLKDVTPTWRFTGSLAQPRKQHDLTLLPDGTVFASGGSNLPGHDNVNGEIQVPEIWDPVTETWTSMASSAEYRGYHSTATLLPDGRVLSAGNDGVKIGGENSGKNAEIFSPPYLFKGPRPTITTAPAGVSLGETFFVETPDAANITAVNWLTPGSTTHAQNWNQRINRLPFTQVAGGLNVTAPANPNLAPPGYYMLFLIDDQGVPSVGKFLRYFTLPLPEAHADLQTTLEDMAVTIPVLANDTASGDIDPTTVTVTSVPANGSTTVDPITGVITYTPNPGYFGTDTFTYTVQDIQLPGLSSNHGPVTMTVLPHPLTNVLPSSGHSYTTNLFTSGQPAFVDDPTTFTTYPALFEGQVYMRTAAADSTGTGSNFLSFFLPNTARVYVLFDTNATNLPAWLGDSSWTILGETVGTTQGIRTVYYQDFPTGTVTLGGNADPPSVGATQMYNVVIIPQDAPGSPTCTLTPLQPQTINSVVNFTVSNVTGTSPITYSWDFGDGSSPTSHVSTSPASHTYTAPERHNVVLTALNPFGTGTCSGVQIIHHPLTVNQPSSASSIVSGGSLLFNVNPDNNSVTALDVNSLTKVWETSVGVNPRTLALAPNGELWVINQDDATISVLNAQSGGVVNTLPLPYASRPYGLVFSPDDSAAYVTLQATGRLLKLNLSGTIIGDLFVGLQPRGLAMSGDATRILITRFISPDTHGEVFEVDALSFTLGTPIQLAFDPGPDPHGGQEQHTHGHGRGVPNYVAAIRISPDGLRALVPSKKDNIVRGLFQDGLQLTFESRVRTIVSQLDLQANVEDFIARDDLDDHDLAQSVLYSPLGDLYFVGIQGNNQIEVFNANTVTRMAILNTGLAPQGMALSPDETKLFVHNYMSRSVSVFDVQSLFAGTSTSVPWLAEIPTVATELLPSQVLDGKRVFYNASDPRMNRDGYLSCASCHLGGGSDGRTWDFTQAGEGLRNTITLKGRAGMGQGNVHWTANFDEIQDFENDIRNGFGGLGFLSDPDFTNTSDPLGNPKAGLSTELDALAAYVSSLTAVPPSPYRKANGRLTSGALAGQQLFLAQSCHSCHSGPGFTDGQRHDVGTIQASSGQGIGHPLAGVGFETPTLKGVWNTAPYFHNGQAATLLDVITHPTHGNTSGLTPIEQQNLVEYLLQIDELEPAPGGPFAQDDFYLASQDTPLTIVAPGILANDGNPQGLPLTITQMSSTTNGAVTLQPDGGFSYTPNLGFSGLDNFTYTIETTPGQPSNVGTARVVVIPPGGPPSILMPPLNMTIAEPMAATFSVLATGEAPMNYQWRRNGVDIPGATSSNYTLSPTSELGDHLAQFDVVVSNLVGTITSSIAVLTMTPAPIPPSVVTEPIDVTVIQPAAAMFSVVADGDVPIHYQWQRNGVDISGAIGASYTLNPTAGVDSGAQFTVVVTNPADTVTSQGATLTVLVPPSIVTQPLDVTVIEPASATLSVVAAGDAPLSYQWQRNGVDISGATGPSYTLNPTVGADSGSQFTVVVTNLAGTVTSQVGMLTVLVPPSIVTQPLDVTVTEPIEATFSVVAAGDAPLSYQWQRNGVDISGATGPSYTLNPTAGVDSGAQFSVVVTNAVGTVTSQIGTLTVQVPPSIVTQPLDVTVIEPASATLSVVAAGDAPLSYQWQRNGVDISGATGSSYTLNPTSVLDSGAQFAVVVTNSAGIVTSQVGKLTVLGPATIVTQPLDVTVIELTAATFSVVAGGDAPLSYQWQRDGVDIGGATGSSYTLTPTALGDSGAQFTAVVTNPVRTVTSQVATLTVLPIPIPPSIVTDPVAVTVFEPGAATFSVVATGDAPLSYQWQRNGVGIPGAISASYTLNPTVLGDSGAQFDVVVTNPGGTITSQVATLTVLPIPIPPSIVTQPLDVTVTEPAAATFNIVASGDAPLSYQWQRDGVNISGAIGSSYTLNPTALVDSGAQFSVVVTNPAGTVLSQSALLSVQGPPPGNSRATDGLVVFYPFNEGGGTSVTDQSNVGAPMNLEISGGIIWNPNANGVVMNGGSGTVASLGSGSKVIVALQLTNTSTFEAWVEPSELKLVAPIVSVDSGASSQNMTMGQKKNDMDIGLLHTTKKEENKPRLETGTDPITQSLLHLVHTYDGTTEKLFVDGVQHPTTVVRVGDYSTWDPSSTFSIGNFATLSSGWKGVMRLVAVYDRPLTDVEVQQNFIAGPEGNSGPPPNQAPVAGNDSAVTTEAIPVSIGVLTNDTDNGAIDTASVLIVNAASNGSAIPDTSGVVTYTPNLGFIGTDNFSYTVKDTLGLTSNEATVSVTINAVPVPPSIVTEPVAVTVIEPSAATFSVVATGDTPLSYQWRRNGVNLPGATTASYTLTPTAVTDSGAQFDVVVTNPAGTVTSQVVTLTVAPLPVPPSIVTEPVAVTVIEPAAATFSVVATGDTPLNYQWRRNGVDLPGATTDSYTLTPTAVADSGAQFDVVVTNALGTVTSQVALLTVTLPPVPPSIVTEPVALTVTEPTAATFSVVATGDTPLSYQWRRNGVNLPGETGTSYTLTPTAVADSGAQYDVVVTNPAGTVTSQVAVLTVIPLPVPPSIVTEPVAVTVTEPTAATFNVVATGDTPLSYQWRRNGVNLPGETGTSYTLTPTTVADSGAQFDVVVTNLLGTVTSQVALLTVTLPPVPPSIVTEPVALTVTEPTAATFSVVATGDTPLTYQWRRNGVNIPGATTNSYTLTPTAVADSGAQFDVVVTNPAGTVTSQVASLTVIPLPVPPSIVTEPVAVTVSEPTAATFNVVAVGDTPLIYQWRRNGVNIPGATTNSYTLTPTAVADSGAEFDVVVTNALGTVTSQVALLTVQASPPVGGRVTNGLVVFYPLTEGGGAIATDQSNVGAPMDLGLSVGVTWNPNGNGVVMNGGTETVASLGSGTKVIDALQLTNTSTFEAWFVPIGLKVVGPIISIDGGPNSLNVGVEQKKNDMEIRLRHTTKKSGNKPQLETGDDPLFTTLMHIVHTYDGTVEKLYINGVQNPTTVVRTGTYANWEGTDIFSLGNLATLDRGWKGTIRLVAVYDRPLTEAEVLQNFAEGPTGQ